MNKELIEKYNTEFNHWLNGGKLLSKHSNDKNWYEATDPSFNNVNVIYIINDEYVEFRKALAEGKTVQFHYINSTIGLDEWQTIKDVNELTFSHSIDLYRIEPEEPQFKVGDWIKNNSSNIVFRYTNDMLKPDLSCCEPWQPKPGEWCWFWDKLGLKPFLSKFIENTKDGSFVSEGITLPSGLVVSTYCEPFIGQLPSICKG